MSDTKLTKADQFCKRAAELVAGDRERTHGAKLPNHQNIADLWNAYLGRRLDEQRLTPLDVSLMMVILKVARTKIGEHNPDNYVDMAGYAGVAGEIAETSVGDGRDGLTIIDDRSPEEIRADPGGKLKADSILFVPADAQD